MVSLLRQGHQKLNIIVHGSTLPTGTRNSIADNCRRKDAPYWRPQLLRLSNHILAPGSHISVKMLTVFGTSSMEEIFQHA
jgi:hypothetical protein